MTNLNGITFHSNNNSKVFYIDTFTHEIKEALKKELTSICHGRSASESGRKAFSYRNTLSEFVKRYETKSENTKKGMIGELLSHIIIKYYFNEYHIGSPFFNLEERSIKKGFDIILLHKNNETAYITEVKSGELHKNKNATQTSQDLLSTAKKDLIERLNDTDNLSLWINAINAAQKAFESHKDLKDSLVEILDSHSDVKISKDLQKSKEYNVILIGAVFADLDDKVEPVAVEDKAEKYLNEDNFNSVFLISLQKTTYDKIYQFIKEESQNG